MVQISQPSPPSSNRDDLIQHGFQHLVHHNAATSFPLRNFDYDTGHHMMSGSGSNFASPPPRYQEDSYYYSNQQSPYSYQHQYQETGPEFKYDGYYSEATQYGLKQSDRQLFPNQYDTSDGLSPSPSMPTPLLDIMRTRSGLALNKTLQPLKPLPQTRSRPPKSPKMKKPKKEKMKQENRIAKLTKPLSELTKGWDHVAIVDIEAYVNRSAEERRKEVEEGKIPGKVKRPMNSFMLYRKAYQNRTKDWCLQNNHQIVSQVCGDSWPLEPESVREQFNEWSRIERENHQNAHPGYKFSPSKGPFTKSSKRKISEEPDSEESDLGDFDWEKGSSKRHKKHPRSPARPVENRSYAASVSPYQNPQSRQVSEEPSYSSYNKSSYQAANPGKPIPVPYDQSILDHGQYYQQTVHNNVRHPGVVEDVVIKKTAVPGMGQLGLPRGHSYTATDQYLLQREAMTLDHRIDPSLIAQDNSLYGIGYAEQESIFNGSNLDAVSQWHAPYGKIDRGLYPEDHSFMGSSQSFHSMQLHEQQLQMLKGNQEGWSIEPLDVGQEFDKWMDEV